MSTRVTKLSDSIPLAHRMTGMPAAMARVVGATSAAEPSGSRTIASGFCEMASSMALISLFASPSLGVKISFLMLVLPSAAARMLTSYVSPQPLPGPWVNAAMVYGPSFLYLVVSTVMAASRTRFCEYCEVAAVGAAAAAAVVGLAAGAAVGAAAGGAGAVVGLAAGAVVGAAAGGDEHALTNSAPAVTMPKYERSFIRNRSSISHRVGVKVAQRSPRGTWAHCTYW